MNINWYGQSCFQISSSQGKNNHVSTLIDPFEESIGLRLPRKLEADVVLITHNHLDHNNVKAVSGRPFIASGPGEYDIKGICIQGIPAFHDNVQGKERGRTTIYTIEAEEIKLCHLGDLGQKELTHEQLDKIGEVDILMLPIGGFFTIDAQEAIKIMAQIEPKIIIPMHYRIPNLKIKLDGLDKFLKIVGVKKIEPLSKLFIKEKDLPKEEVKIIVLQP
ncbi:MAG: MBL fold metallo-hydrolase [Candidatus Nealsonbacteria bacterium CG10_big_fil_rev_8_21_14_0_10_36_24]|uniref:MBL fold metallo-hydrolase n=2 Tax=Candidatus Nealsoniibacteriota TaxID=1817911 RepID=A0A2H0YNQ5_9BACT|nr:MAG: MBL fold metallo-hydrolase [Candidatus Nealsonbacteria bacterium CG10_big_fil_rev_8_21_14_0_10_36_24]PIS40056.1 MAG: MBL fold metallo-hydrolase [Candidatus Nealsonbacteria bacterium CG08_land_8_20_14_0_20_36_22]